MADKYIILKITNKGVFYNEDAFIEWRNTNFPPKKEFNFNDERDSIFWEAKLLPFDKENSQLKVDVVDYNVKQKEESFVKQRAKFLFQRIWFNTLKWSELEKVMNIYTKILFDRISDSGEQSSVREKGAKNLVDYSEAAVKDNRIDISFKFPLMKAKSLFGFYNIEK